MVLINCGGCANLVELLQPEGSVQLYIIDSQRPLNLENVYNQDQIHVVVREDDQLEVPEFDDIYSSDLVRHSEGVRVCEGGRGGRESGLILIHYRKMMMSISVMKTVPPGAREGERK